MYLLFLILQKTHVPSTNDTYFTMKRGKSYYGGKGYYIVRFPPGEKLLYSQFSGGKGYYGGKATIQHRNYFEHQINMAAIASDTFANKKSMLTGGVQIIGRNSRFIGYFVTKTKKNTEKNTRRFKVNSSSIRQYTFCLEIQSII